MGYIYGATAMESSRNKVEAMKPVLFKAGIPLAMSVAGFLIAKITTRKSSLTTASSQIEVNNVEETDHAYADAEEILRLRRVIEEIEGRESQVEKRFLTYQSLKDREMALMELQSKMMVEIDRVAFLEREVSSVEAENRRFESVVREYLELLRLEEAHRSENERLRGKVRRLLRKSLEHSRILGKQCLLIRCKDLEISRNRNEIRELKLVIEQLQGEKTAASKGEEEYNMLLQELDLLQKHKASEWDNEGGVEQGEAYFGVVRNGDHSKRRRLMAKLKRWVEGKGSSMDEKERLHGDGDGSKCFPRHSVSGGDQAQHAYAPARKSCSSV